MENIPKIENYENLCRIIQKSITFKLKGTENEQKWNKFCMTANHLFETDNIDELVQNITKIVTSRKDSKNTRLYTLILQEATKLFGKYYDTCPKILKICLIKTRIFNNDG